MAEASALDVVKTLLAFLTGAVYLYVGARLSRRHVEGDARLAWNLFTQWWYALGVISVTGELSTFLPLVGVTDGAVFVSFTHVLLLGLCYAFFCLVYYLVYLYTGTRRTLVPVAFFYALLYVAILYYVNWAGMYYDQAAGKIDMVRQPPHAIRIGLGLLFVLPIIGAAAMYFRLWFKVDEPTQRYRIALIAGTLVTWFGSTLLSYLPAGDETVGKLPWWPVATRLLGLGAALLILMAYVPPAWIRERYDVLPIEERPRRMWARSEK
ncbi:MAG TPA: hypothetical protein VHH36_04570 [Candidatus Thermoplasmatota archaeon]|nr:hypothetical protein [Candidatus Thermoplasmatota archaeon]